VDKLDQGSIPEQIEANDGWVKPEIVSFEPVKAAEGISYLPSDGVSNLTP
jgi:hypothetical protein